MESPFAIRVAGHTSPTPQKVVMPDATAFRNLSDEEIVNVFRELGIETQEQREDVLRRLDYPPGSQAPSVAYTIGLAGNSTENRGTI